MLKSLVVRNFQAHKASRLEFHPGVNAIIGESNSGKTALFRLIKWVWKNRPLGTRFQSNFSVESTYGAIAFDNKEISLEKEREGGAVYRIMEDGKLVGEYSSFGSDTPDLVPAYLNLDESINMQDQLDKHFLITASPGQVAAEFNKITHIEKAAIWVKSLASKINGETRDIKLLDEQIAELEKKIFGYRDAVQLEETVTRAEYLLKQLEKVKKDAEALAHILSERKLRLAEKAELEEMISPIEEAIKELEHLRPELQKKGASVVLLRTLVRDNAILVEEKQLVAAVEESISVMERLWPNLQKKTASLSLLRSLIQGNAALAEQKQFVKFMEPSVQQLDKLIPSYLEVQQTRATVADVLGQVKKKEELLRDWNKELGQNRNSLVFCLKLLGKCPTCYSAVTPEVIDNIIKEL